MDGDGDGREGGWAIPIEWPCELNGDGFSAEL